MSAYEITLKLNGAKDATKQLKAVEGAAKGVSRATSRPMGPGSVLQQHASLIRAQNAYSNAYARQSISGQNQQAAAMASHARLIRAQNALQRAMSSQAKLLSSGSGSQSHLARHLRSYSRLRIGKGPLALSSSADFMGIASKAIDAIVATGPIGIAIAAVVTALAATAGILTAMAAVAQRVGLSLTKVYFAGGGSVGNSARLMNLAAMAGVSPEAMAGQVNGFNQQLISNPYARLFAAKHGVNPNFIGAFGDINNTARFNKFLGAVLSSNISDNVARRAASGTAAENYLWLRKADPGLRKLFMGMTQASMTPTAMRDSANAQVLLNLAMAKFHMLIVKIGLTVLPTLNVLLAGFAATIKYLTVIVAPAVLALQWIGKILYRIGHPFSPMPKEFNGKDPVDKNTDALNNNTRALNNQRQTYGGGDYANRALPNRYFGPQANGVSWNNSIQRQQIHQGIVPIG